MSRSQFDFKCLNATIPLTCTLSKEYPAMRSVRRIVQCKGIVSLAMACYLLHQRCILRRILLEYVTCERNDMVVVIMN